MAETKRAKDPRRRRLLVYGGSLALLGAGAYVEYRLGIPPEPQIKTIEDRIREDLAKRVDLTGYPDVKLSYPRQIARFVDNPYMGEGDIQFYFQDADIHTGLIEKKIKLDERGRSGIPLKFSGSGFSNADVYDANLEESLINQWVYSYDIKQGKSRNLLGVTNQHKILETNFYNFDDISEEVGNEIEDASTFNSLIDWYANHGITRALAYDFNELKEAFEIARQNPSTSYIPMPSNQRINEILDETKGIIELDNKATTTVLKMKDIGTYGEKMALADRGYTRGKFEHDLGRPITVGRLWTRGMTAYEGIATLPHPNPLVIPGYGQYTNDGFTSFPLIDATKQATEVATERTTQSWGYYTDDLIRAMLVVGKPFKSVSIGTSRGRSFFYGTQ